MLDRLNEVNDVTITSVFDNSFKTYGNIVKGYDFSQMIDYMEKNTEIPENGNIYVASVPEMEELPVTKEVKQFLYGDMEIQVGYCNGRNTTYNGFEYHKGSEINVALTDLCLVLGHTWEIAADNTYKVEDAKVFFVPKGTVIEMFQTTLHLSPCRVSDEGFKDIVILPKGTNTPLDKKPENAEGEDRLLLQRNKWVISHPEREPLMKQGAFPGLIGENKAINY